MKNTLLQQTIQERFGELPKVVQHAITDSNVAHTLQRLSQKHKLHFDQWELLENEIMFVLLGLEEPEDMAKNVAQELSISEEAAQPIVSDIVQEVFVPIRKLIQHSSSTPERETYSPNAPTKRAPSDTTAYKTGEVSSARKDVQEDPYRESIE